MQALFEYLKADPVLHTGSVFADVGAGTGIFSAQQDGKYRAVFCCSHWAGDKVSTVFMQVGLSEAESEDGVFG